MEQNFRVVIWGLGTNGKNLIDALGEEHVAAIIDSNVEKLKMHLYQNIPLITFDEYQKKYNRLFIAVTPMRYQEIEEMLLEHQIHWYFLLSENKISLMAFMWIKTGQFIRQYQLDKDCHYYISGVNLFSVYLYRYLLQNSINAELIASTDKDTNMLSILKDKNVIERYSTRMENIEHVCLVKTADTVWERSVDLKIIDYKYINDKIYQSWKKDLRKYKNCNYGRRIFIVATGPSITLEDLEKLEKSHELTISMNGIIYLLNKTSWRPDYYVASDGEMIRIYEDEMEKENCLEKAQKFFSDNYLKFWEKEYDATYHCFHQVQSPYDIRFSSDFSEKVYAGFTVVYACIQLAVYMGAKEIYLLGCDFSFSEDMNDAGNHCYNQPSQFYTFDFEGVLRGYECAKKYADEHEIKIYNATRGGKLEVFERKDFDSLF